MYARAECLRRGIALGCVRARKMHHCRNGARTGLEHMPDTLHRPGADRTSRARRQATGSLIELNKPCGVQRDRQTGFNHINQRASRKRGSARQTYPYSSSNLVQRRCPIRLQQRCNPDARSDDAYTSFHRICKSARPMETPLCRMCFLFLHLRWLCNRRETIIYSK